jgi:esterase/lipase superfamily enzyme
MRGIQLVLMVFAIVLAPTSARTASFDWQEAVSRIAAERQRAVVCARQLKKHGDDEAVRIGGQLYEEARAELNAVTEALIKALAEDQAAPNFANIEAQLKLGLEKREALCDQASRWLPETEGEKDLLTDVKSFSRGLIIDAFVGIWGNASDEEALTRRTIATQLEGTSWDDFGTATGGVESVQTTVPAETAEPREFSVVKVFFGTDRKNEGTLDAPRFGGERGGAVSLGEVVVTVPKGHRLAQVERPGSFIGANEDPAKHFTLQAVQLQDQADFTARLREIVGAAKRFEKQAFVFVHGFNVGFDAAAYRTAQIAYDLRFDGAPIFYSWPSRGGIVEYEYDQNSARQARRHLRSFLELVRSQSGAEVVHVLAHSMGTDPLMEVLASLQAARPASQKPLFNQVILAAPDIDRDVFLELAKQVRGVAEGITLYASSRDVALQTSQIYARGVPRAGDVPATIGPVIDVNVDTIDASEISIGTNFFSLKHSEYSDNPILLNDIALLMQTGQRPPDKRLLVLQEKTLATGRYWVYPRWQ